MESGNQQLVELERYYTRYLRAVESGDPAERTSALARLYRATGSPFGIHGRAVLMWEEYGTWTTEN